MEAKKPKTFLLENVKNLVSHDSGKTFEVISKTLYELGYKIYPQVLDGKYFVPQHRENSNCGISLKMNLRVKKNLGFLKSSTGT